MTRMTLELHPVDVLMFRDSRWSGIGASASESVFPVPRTVAGAVRTLMLDACSVDFGRLRCALSNSKDNSSSVDPIARLNDALKGVGAPDWAIDAHIMGPFLADAYCRYFPVPRAMVHAVGSSHATWAGTGTTKVGCDDKVLALRPMEVSSGDWYLTPGTPVVFEDLPEAYIPQHQLITYLNGAKDVPDYQDIVENALDRRVLGETRVGVGMDPDCLTAKTGLLFTSTFARLAKGWHLEVDLLFGQDDGAKQLAEFARKRPWARLGGDGKVARVRIAKSPWKQWEPPTGSSRRLLYLATPGLFAHGSPWPGCLSKAKLCGAITGRPLPFSGWDLGANLPMPSRYAVRAGAVYFVDGCLADTVHGKSISDSGHDQAAGWGYCFEGAW